MKKIILLLLSTIASYGQAVFDEGIQITGNANSATATKVNVQEANGKVNTQTIKTGFNKNIGLGGSDVVGANTLLNQYSTTPVDWTATAFDSGQVVFYGGKQWIAKMATVAGDVPAVSSKWEEITFEALANKTKTVDQTIIDGSTNSVSGNAVFDGLATKFPTPTGLTTNYLPKWNGSGFGNSGFYEDALGLNISGKTKGITFDNPKIGVIVYSNGILHKIDGVDKWSINVGAGDGSENYNIYSFDASKRLVSYKTNGNIEFIPNGGRILINKTDDDLTNKLQVAGTISASPATTANQVVVKSQLDAVAGTSGTYMPTFSNLVNVDVVNITNAIYTKVGNIIQGRCTASINTITIGLDTSFDFSLPQARNSKTNILLCGNGARFQNNIIANGITYIQSINTGRFIFKASGSIGSSDIVTFNFQYDITQ